MHYIDVKHFSILLCWRDDVESSALHGKRRALNSNLLSRPYTTFAIRCDTPHRRLMTANLLIFMMIASMSNWLSAINGVTESLSSPSYMRPHARHLRWKYGLGIKRWMHYFAQNRRAMRFRYLHISLRFYQRRL